MTLVQELAAEHRPWQFALLEQAIDVLARSDRFQQVLVRGSLARGRADALSDLDLVVAVEDAAFPEFVKGLDTLMSVELAAILPGWRDRLVGDFRGLGFVYLVAWESKLRQLDMYVVPASRLADIVERTHTRPVWVSDRTAAGPTERTERFVGDLTATPASCADLLVEAVVVAYMLRKQIARGRGFLAYSLLHLLTTAAKDLAKTALVPKSEHYGWYYLDEEIGATPIGRACLEDLRALMDAPPVPTVVSVRRSLERIRSIAERAAPETLERLRPGLDAFDRYLEAS